MQKLVCIFVVFFVFCILDYRIYAIALVVSTEQHGAPSLWQSMLITHPGTVGVASFLYPPIYADYQDRILEDTYGAPKIYVCFLGGGVTKLTSCLENTFTVFVEIYLLKSKVNWQLSTTALIVSPH